jgi:hypothetical protein
MKWKALKTLSLLIIVVWLWGSDRFVWAAPSTTVNNAGEPLSLIELVAQSNRQLTSESQFLTYLQRRITTERTQLKTIRLEIARLERLAQAERSQVVSLLQFQYEYGGQLSEFWLRMIFTAKSWTELESNLNYVHLIINHRAHVLKHYASDEHQLQSAQTLSMTQLEDLDIAEINVAMEKRDYALAVLMSSSGSPSAIMRNLHSILGKAWDTAMAPQLAGILSDLDASAATLPSALPKSDLHLSLTSAEITLPQSTFNHILARNKSLRDVKFLFRPGHLLVFAKRNAHSLLMIGHFAISHNRQIANYVIDDVAVDGLLVPHAQVTSWLKPYHFDINVARLSTHIQMTSIQLANQEMILKLTIA